VLQGVAEMCRRTTLACLQDGFVDGVWREASLWLGDAVAQDWALRAVSDDPRPLLYAIDMAAEGADAEGLLPSVLPGEVPAYAVTDYNFAWVELLAGCTTHPGVSDPEAIWQRHWGTLIRMLERMATYRGPDGLLRNSPGRRLFLDWSPMCRVEPNLTLNLRYLHALRLAAGIAERVGRTADWAEAEGALVVALQEHKAPDGWRESPGGEAASQLGLALLILSGMVEGSAAEALADRIVARSLNLEDGPVAGQPALASPFMHHYLFQALQRLGRRAEIHAIIAARWGRWVREGRPTTPENWSIDFPDGSACHGFSAHPLGWL
jgi:Bacterial alpha-L-rhamnosidase 6 hairpin glycosidase domain